MFGQPVGKSWYFENTTHTEAVNRLIYVAEQGEAFVLLTGEHGVGKTTVLNQVKNHCGRLGCSSVQFSVAALDEMSFLWQLCGGLSITPKSNQTRSEIMAAIRDELSGRALCNSRTVIILDDLHAAADDLALMIQFIGAINQQTDGGVSVIAAGDRSLSSEIQGLSALCVRLPVLDDTDSRDFIHGSLASDGVDASRVSIDGLNALLEFGQGNLAQLARICELVQVAAATDNNLTINAEVLEALTAETLGV